MITLNQLPLDFNGKIIKLNLLGDIRRRMLDLGIVPGTIIMPVLTSPSLGIRAFEVRNSIFAIRDEDAEKILVSKI